MRDLTCYGSIDIKNIGFTLEQNGSLFDDPKCMVFADPPFVEEVILEKVEIGLVRIVRREELSVGWNADCRLRDLVNDTRMSDMLCDGKRNRRTSLMIRSRVLMTAPLSRRCIDRSTDGLFAGFLCSISCMALSTCVDMVSEEREAQQKAQLAQPGCTIPTRHSNVLLTRMSIIGLPWLSARLVLPIRSDSPIFSTSWLPFDPHKRRLCLTK